MLDKFNKRTSTAETGTPAAVRKTQPEQPAPSPQPKPQAKATIGPGLNVSGDLAGEADLSVEGAVEGTINLPSNVVTITQSGEVKASITAATINVSGRVIGDMVGIEQVVLAKTAVVRGNITAPRVNLESGSKFKGSIDMDPVEDKAGQTAAPLADKTAKAKGAPVKVAAAAASESAARH